jgi:hypothetical protein
MQGSKFTPTNVDNYGRSDMETNFQGAVFDITPGDTAVHDYQVLDDHIFDGCDVSVIGNAAKGDYLIAQIVDVDGILYPAGTVLKTFAPNWQVVPGVIKQLEMQSRYPAKIIHGLYIRTSYVSLGSDAAYVVINYRLHKVLW